MNLRKIAGSGVLGCAVLLSLLLTGCATSVKKEATAAVKKSVVVKNADLGLDAPQTPAPPALDASAAPPVEAFEEYRIGPGDILMFRLLSDDTLSGEVEVRYDGHVSLPLIPDMKVQGMTRQEATDCVRKAYEKEFQEPRISLSIQNAMSKSFHVIGDVAQPREVPYTRPVTLLEAINICGGLRQSQNSGDTSLIGRSQLSKAFIIRHQEGKRSVTNYDLRSLEQSGEHASDTRVSPGDIVYIPETVNLAYVMGEIKRPGAYRITDGVHLLSLLALANGPVESRAKMRQVVLLRGVDTEKTEVILLNLREMLKNPVNIPKIQSGDILYVPPKNLVRISEFVGLVQSTISPSLSMYMQAYDAYYTKQTYDNISKTGGTGTSLLSIEQLLRNVTSLTSTVAK